MFRSLCCIATSKSVATKSVSSDEPADSNEETSSYPPKIHPSNTVDFTESENDLPALKEALANGLDPNTLWTEDDLIVYVKPHGCVEPTVSLQSLKWRSWNTPLHRALFFQGFDSAEYLLQNGADIDLRSGGGWTAVQQAIMESRPETLKFLIEHGADLDSKNERDEFPLQFALRGGEHEMFRMIVEAGAKTEDILGTRWNIVDLVLLSGDRMALQVLFDHDPSLKPSPFADDAEEPSTCDPAAAKELLAVVTSVRFLPAPELYPAYCQVVSSMSEFEKLQWGVETIGNFIEGFDKALFKAAGIMRPAARIQLCSACSAFQSGISRLQDTSEKEFPLPFRSKVRECRGDLNESARNGCPLCGLVADALDNSSARRKTKPGKSSDTSITFELRYGSSGPEWKQGRLAVEDAGRGREAVMDLTDLDERYIPEDGEAYQADTSTGSNLSFQTAKVWLENCKTLTEHAVCREAQCKGSEVQIRPLPSRVLDLTGDDPHLVEGDGVNAPYCALSYCRGELSNTTALTTQANMSERMKRITTDSLPPFIQDAIQAAKSLGYQYLWVDALCIIQDDQEDWDREVSRMNEIYSNADLTISSLVAKDCQEPLFRPRSPRVSRPVPLNLWRPKRFRPAWVPGYVHQVAVRPYSPWNQKPDKQAPVHSRGWTLQEQLLSTRILYFGDGRLNWECAHFYLAEGDPNSPVENWDFTVKWRRSARRALRDARPQSDGSWDGYHVWKTQLEEYSSRTLSKQEDRIPAFLGVCKSLEKTLGDEFIGGIWKGDRMLESLCWKVNKPDSEEPRRPSWSWAAVSGPISFSYVGQSAAHPLATVVSVDVETNESQSRVAGSITLKGSLYKQTAVNAFLSNVCIDHEVDVAESYYGLDLVGFKSGPPHEGYGKPVWPGGRPAEIVRLLLQPVETDFKHPSVFRRVGIAMYEGHHTAVTVAELTGKESAVVKWQNVKWCERDRAITIV